MGLYRKKASGCGCSACAKKAGHAVRADMHDFHSATQSAIRRAALQAQLADPQRPHTPRRSRREDAAKFLRVLETTPPERIIDRIARKRQDMPCSCHGAPRGLGPSAEARLPTRAEIAALTRSLRRWSRRDPRVRKATGEPVGFPASPPAYKDTDGPIITPKRQLVASQRINRGLKQSSVLNDHMGRFTSSVSAGAFNLNFAAYYPPTSSSDREDTLEWAWDPYYTASSTLGYGDLHSMIAEWEADSDSADFLFWRDGWGGSHRAFLHALRLLDVFRDFIFNDGTSCANARTLFTSKFDSLGYEFRVDDHWTCSDTADTITYDGTSAFPIGISHSGDRGLFNTVNQSVHPCASLVDGQGHVADALMFFSHECFWYVLDGEAADIWEAISYLWQGLMIGRLALGAVTMVSRTTLHEMMHDEFPGDHCDLNCCQQRIALRWQCRAFSTLGLYVADSDNGIDAGLSGRAITYSSTCKAPLIGASQAFRGSCTMNDPGTQSGEDNWTGRGSWTNPPGCP